MSVYLHLAAGFEELEAMSIVDVLRRGGVDVKTVSIMGEKLVEGDHGIKIEADLLFEEADYDSCEMIVMPGGLPGADRLRSHKGLESKILSFAESGKWLAAICAAPRIYGELGLLKDREAVVYPGLEAYLLGAKSCGKDVAVDGKFVTSRGPGTALAFALTLLSLLGGEETEKMVRGKMLLA